MKDPNLRAVKARAIASVASVGLCCLGAWGCGGSDPVAVETGPTGTMRVTFLDPPSGQGPQCVSIGDDPSAEVPLLVRVEEIELAQPRSCGNFAQCGYLQLHVDGLLNNEGAVPAIPLLLRKFGDPYRDADNPFMLSVQAVDQDGAPLLEAEQPVVDTVELITVPDCATLGEGGGGGGAGGCIECGTEMDS